jgi:Flp pilus assembly pilin Flp
MGKRGQGLVEYILIVFLMGIAAISWLHNLRDRTQSGFTKASQNLQTEFGG